MFSALMTTKRFAPVFWVQFFSALNDNFVKNALAFLILYKLQVEGGASLVTLAAAILIAPFFFLSGVGGQLADRFDKSTVAQKIKLAEIPVALIAATGFALDSVPLLFGSLFLYGCGAALFGPIKYGILPVHLEERELSAGNALVEGATFLAILLGTLLGGLAAAQSGASLMIAGGIVGLAALGWLSSRYIPLTGSAAPNLVVNKNPLVSTIELVRDLKSYDRLWVGGLITSWFWAVGIVSLSLLPTMMKDVIGGDEGVATSGLLVFTIGIAIGSAIAAAASKKGPNLKLVPIGALLMSLFALDISYITATLPAATETIDAWTFATTLTGARMLFDLTGLAVAGGLYIVPAFASVQAWAPDNKKSRIVAACNVLNAFFMTTASLAFAFLQSQGVGLTPLWLTIGASNLIAIGLIIYAWGPEIRSSQS